MTVLERPGHKVVRAEAREIEKLMLAAREHGISRWFLVPSAPRWVRANRSALELLDLKLHNQHHFAENLRLALTPIQLK